VTFLKYVTEKKLSSYTGWSKKYLCTWWLQYKSSGAQRLFDHPVYQG